jgi:hypothetical protein
MFDTPRVFETRNASSTTTCCETQMGKQVRFYMDCDDERAFLSFLETTGSIALLQSIQQSEAVYELTELPKLGTPFSLIIWVWNKDISEPPRLRFVKEQNCFMIDGINSELIEWCRSSESNRQLTAGRIWAETTKWSSETPTVITHKSAAFNTWTNQILSWIKRHSTKANNGVYHFPGARSHYKLL